MILLSPCWQLRDIDGRGAEFCGEEKVKLPAYVAGLFWKCSLLHLFSNDCQHRLGASSVL